AASRPAVITPIDCRRFRPGWFSRSSSMARLLVAHRSPLGARTDRNGMVERANGPPGLLPRRDRGRAEVLVVLRPVHPPLVSARHVRLERVTSACSGWPGLIKGKVRNPRANRAFAKPQP